MTYVTNDKNDAVAGNDVKVKKDPLVYGFYMIDDVDGNHIYEGRRNVAVLLHPRPPRHLRRR